MTLNPSNANVTATVGTTLTTAEILAGFISRSGPTGDFNDTLPPTADIIAALGGGPGSWIFRYCNASAHNATILPGDADTTVTHAAGMFGNGNTVRSDGLCEVLVQVNGGLLTVTLLFASATI